MGLMGAVIVENPLSAASAPTVLKIGVTAGPHFEILTFLKDAALKKGIVLKVIEFNDFILPNVALAEGALDANIYQHQAFLEAQKESRGFKFVELGKTILLPMRAYSSKVTRLEDLPHAGKIALPNDPSNSGRALHFLANLGLIQLKEDAGVLATVIDIVKNHHHFKFVEVDAPQVPRVLDDVDLALVNADWAVVAGLDSSFLIAQEAEHSLYANLIVIREDDQNRSDLATLKALYQSSQTKAFLEERFQGSIQAAW